MPRDNLDALEDWRDKVLKRDRYTCKACKKKARKLEAHHIRNYAEHPKLRHLVSNGVTLCYRCHKLFHQLYGRIGNNKAQLTHFIASTQRIKTLRRKRK